MRLRDGQSLNFAVPIEAVKALSLKARLSSVDDAALELRDGDVMKDPSYKVFNDAFQAGDWNAASDALKGIVGHHPEWAFGYSMLGFSLHVLGRNQEALVAGKRAVELNPNDCEAWLNIGLALRGLGNGAEAIAAFKQAARLKPQSSEAWSNLFDLYLEISDKANAAIAVQMVQEIARRRKQRGNEQNTPKFGF